MRTKRSWKGWRRVKLESRLDPQFADRIAALAGGDTLRECIQCGTCSAVCPMSAYMDYTPRQLIAMTRAGFKDEVLSSLSIWVCASCYACTVECPKQIPVTEVMHALKRTAVQEEVHPKRFAVPVLARIFVHDVDSWGRNTESRLAMKLYLRTRPTLMLKDAVLGQRLMRRGRMGLRRESVRERAQLRTMLRALGDVRGAS
jgi:quinone-modifying oxidoreductase subunit QmoC